MRTGLVVKDDIVYTCNGHFPLEGTYQTALDAADGSVIWQKIKGVAAQGYLLAGPDHLVIPTGRASPEIFDRATGAFVRKTSTRAGGTFALLTDDLLITGPGATKDGRLEVMIGKNRSRLASFAGRHLIAHRGTFYFQTGRHLLATDARKVRSAGKKNTVTVRYDGPEWRRECNETVAMILAGEQLIAGEDGRVIAYDIADGKVRWEERIDGVAYGLAVADGALFVSSDRGVIYRFGETGAPQVAESTTSRRPAIDSSEADRYGALARTVLQSAPVKKGLCLVLGVDDGQFLESIADQSDLRVIGIHQDANRVEAVRRSLDQRRKYGGRIRVQRADPYRLPYTDYLFNLVVVHPAGGYQERRDLVEPVFRLLRPIDGTAMVYLRDDKSAEGLLADWRQAGEITTRSGVLTGDADGGSWLRIERDRSRGMADWTHMYAEPGNSTYGGDQHVGGDMELLWFGRPGPRDMVNRHHHATAPLSVGGRLFIPGNERMFAVDLYNGTPHWEIELPRSRRLRADLTGNILVAGNDTLHMAVDDKCLRIDMATGTQKNPFPVPQLFDGKTY